MRNILDKACTKHQNIFYVQKLLPENRAVYKVTKEKYGTSRQAREEYCTAHILYMLDN